MSIKLDHINLTVTNLDESIQWYQDVFGFKRVEGGQKPSGRRWAIVASNDSMIAMTEIKEWARATQDDFNIHRIYHFGIRVPNSSDWRSTIEKHNLKTYYGGEIPYPHSRSWYVHDPSGHEIEVSCTEGRPLQFPE